MRRACASLLIVTVVLAGKGLDRAGQEPILAAPTPLESPRCQGVASCASAACHHANGPAGSQGSEYTTWVNRDPHSRAYQVLFDARSTLMAKNLGRGKKAHEDALCLSCHVQPDYEHLRTGPRWTVQDGVGCEACHGAAEKWLSTHYQRPGQRLDDMKDTRDLRVRAEACVRCHVGEGEADVNHDLIAAGHPRLRFDFGAYLANYPRHWDVRKDRERYPDFEARAWLLGQVESARAAVDLLAHRSGKTATWPEFAEYGCFSCHQDLRGQLRAQGGERGTVGKLRWGTWYASLLPALPALESAGRPADLKDSLDSLRELMGKSYPNPRQVAGQAKKVSAELAGWSRDLGKTEIPVPTQQRLLAELIRDRDRPFQDGWDGAAQLYLGIGALYLGLGDRGDAGLKPAIQELAAHLNQAFRDPDHPQTRYDSPRDYDPKKIREDLSRLQELLQRPRLP